jgi:hypothetical protein
MFLIVEYFIKLLMQIIPLLVEFETTERRFNLNLITSTNLIKGLLFN